MRHIKNRKGVTLIELIVVLIIIAAIGAVAALNFGDRIYAAKLKSDIQSTRVLQGALDLYDAEQTTPLDRTSATTDFAKLATAGYVRNASTVSQCGGEWVYDSKKLFLKVNYADPNVKKHVDVLSSEEDALIKKS